jgi:predicted lipoprotein with Yx(FWY)xxD motif
VRILGNSKRGQLVLAAAVLAVTTAAAFGAASAAKGGVAAQRHSASSVAVKTRNVKGLGVVLVNAKGRTLYVFMNDKQRRVTCTGSCANFWPPLKWKGAGKPSAGGSAQTKFLGSDKDPSGGRVVTYNRWPLYTYSGDHSAGQATGEGLDLSGGKWYVMSAKGKIVKHKTSSGGGGGGGGGWG